MKSVQWHSKNVLFWNDPLLPIVGSLEIYLPDDVTIKLIDFFICTWQCVRNVLVHSYEQLTFACDVVCLCLHFDTVTQMRSFRHDTLADMRRRRMEVFMAVVAEKCMPMTRLHCNFVFLQHVTGPDRNGKIIVLWFLSVLL